MVSLSEFNCEMGRMKVSEAREVLIALLAVQALAKVLNDMLKFPDV